MVHQTMEEGNTVSCRSDLSSLLVGGARSSSPSSRERFSSATVHILIARFRYREESLLCCLCEFGFFVKSARVKRHKKFKSKTRFFNKHTQSDDDSE